MGSYVVQWDGMGCYQESGMGSYGIGWDHVGLDGILQAWIGRMRWDGILWDGMGCDVMGRDGI